MPRIIEPCRRCRFVRSVGASMAGAKRLILPMAMLIGLAIELPVPSAAQTTPSAVAASASAPAATPPGPIVPTERITLLNGKDLTGWRIYTGTAATVPNTAPASAPAEGTPKFWTITDGVLKLDTKSAGYVVTEKTYANYKLH